MFFLKLFLDNFQRSFFLVKYLENIVEKPFRYIYGNPLRHPFRNLLGNPPKNPFRYLFRNLSSNPLEIQLRNLLGNSLGNQKFVRKYILKQILCPLNFLLTTNVYHKIFWPPEIFSFKFLTPTKKALVNSVKIAYPTMFDKDTFKNNVIMIPDLVKKTQTFKSSYISFRFKWKIAAHVTFDKWKFLKKISVLDICFRV